MALRPLLVVSIALVAAVSGPRAQDPGTLPTIAAHTSGAAAYRGLLDFYWQPRQGKLWLEIGAFDEDLLYAVSMATGLGSNPVGIDRGQLSGQQVVVFQRAGPKVLLVARNLGYRALSGNAAERRAVTDSFAPSVLQGFDIVAEQGGRVLVDATAFLLRDARGVARTLEQRGQGKYKLDRARSALHLPRCAAFPDNVEMEATLTFTATDPGRLVARTAATGEAVTLRQHHSFVRLPDDGYVPRVHDPRVGYMTVSFADYAAPIDAPLRKRWIRRHHLRKRDPQAEVSEPVQRIVYHLDPGVPEPVRSALREGASWWAEAFEAAGFKDAFRIEDLPAGADPMDVRYNMIHWVHRRTRGWSYGASVVDPRTGQILKGNVLLGSLRVRQDHMILRGLGAPADGACCAGAGPDGAHYLLPAADERAVELSLARLRQLAAHEVGHTLGLTHNFAASTYDDRASVMDYPAPLVTVGAGGELDMTRAYARGIGSYDKWAIRYGYTQLAPGADEQAALREIVAQGFDRLPFISDADARPASAAHPMASLWDNGADPVAALREALAVRAAGLAAFAARAPLPDEPVAMLEDLLVPLFLHHRYQLTATVKSLGGVHYDYAVGDKGTPPRPVAAAQQRAALAAVLACLEPDTLTLPATILAKVPPHPPGYGGGETFGRRTGAPLDPVAMATTAADLAVGGLLQRERAARLVEHHARDQQQPGFATVVDALVAQAYDTAPPADALARAVQRAIQRVVADRLMDLAGDARAAPDVRAVAVAGLRAVVAGVDPTPPPLDGGRRVGGVDAAHRAALRRDIAAFLDGRAARPSPTPAPAAPPGDPIGSGAGRGGAGAEERE